MLLVFQQFRQLQCLTAQALYQPFHCIGNTVMLASGENICIQQVDKSPF